MSSADGHLERISVRILRYLLDHPDAADTARGVREWWLAGMQVSARDVELTLEVLQGRGWLRGKRMGDGQVLYEANQQFLVVIRAEAENLDF